MVDGRTRGGRRGDIDGSGIGIHGAALLWGCELSPCYLGLQARFAQLDRSPRTMQRAGVVLRNLFNQA
jgi:hypothetical protein